MTRDSELEFHARLAVVTRHEEEEEKTETKIIQNKNDCQHSKTRSKHIKGSKEHLFVMTQTHSLHIFREIPFVKPQNNT